MHSQMCTSEHLLQVQNSHGEQDSTATSFLMSGMIFHVAQIRYFLFIFSVLDPEAGWVLFTSRSKGQIRPLFSY